VHIYVSHTARLQARLKTTGYELRIYSVSSGRMSVARSSIISSSYERTLLAASRVVGAHATLLSCTEPARVSNCFILCDILHSFVPSPSLLLCSMDQSIFQMNIRRTSTLLTSCIHATCIHARTTRYTMLCNRCHAV
jgi:hypothetical protein